MRLFHPPLRLSIFYGSRDQPRPGSFLKKREEPGNEVGYTDALYTDVDGYRCTYTDAQHTTNSYNNSNPTTDTIFHFHRINVENVFLALMNLKINKSTGLDKIPANVLRLSADIIAPSLTYIFNLSLDIGIYVDDWIFPITHYFLNSNQGLDLNTQPCLR